MNRIYSFFAQSITVKVTAGMVVILFFALSTVTAVYLVVNAQKGDAVVINDAGKLRMLSQKIAKATFMVALGNEPARTELEETARVFDKTFNGVRFGNRERGIAPAPQALQPQLVLVAEIWSTYQANLYKVLESAPSSPALTEAVADIKATNLTLLKEANAAVQLFEIEAKKKVRNLFILLGIFLLLDLAAFTIAFRLLRRALHPIKDLVDATERVAQGDLTVSVAVNTPDEIGVLSHSFNAMMRDVQESSRALHMEKAEVQRRAEEAKGQRHYLARNVECMLEEMNRFAKGDLTVRLTPERTDDEIAHLFQGFNRAVENVNHLFGRVRKAVETTMQTTLRITTTTEQLATGAQEQSTQVHEVVHATEEMSRTIYENAEQVAGIVEAAQQSGEVAEHGGKIVERTVVNIRQVADNVSLSSQKVEELGKSSQQISEIVSTIEDIAAQTSLLALNAAIEAARAGEHGKGFAVVAGEVRQLARRTTQATQQIAGMITGIQTDTQDAIASMQHGTDDVDAGIALADEAGRALTRIVKETQITVDLINQIASASEEQAATSEQIAQSVEAISSVADEAAQGITSIAQSTGALNHDMDQLLAVVSQFIVNAEETQNKPRSPARSPRTRTPNPRLHAHSP